jgi:Domain of unknown function (DUF6265)
MEKTIRITLLLATILALSLTAFAQERLTERTLKLNPGKQSPPASVADMAWMAGSWNCEALGGLAEEIWSAPRNGGMMGMFRLIKNGSPVFYELFTLVEDNGSLILRLKHFNPNMTGWEEKDQTIDFPLVAKEPGVIYFDGMTFKRESPDAVTIFLAIHSKKDGGVREEAFRYTRVK